jgi:hypothetical protein
MRFSAWGRTSALAFVLTACASDGAPEGGDASRGGASAGAPGQSGAATAGSATGGASLVAGAANAGSNTGGAAAAPSAGSAGSFVVGGGACREDVPDAEWDANCLSCAAGDACASCACQSCAAEIHTCEDTPGCLEIAACVKLASCVGVECYCGTDTAATCANGGGNGPCKAAVLNAPGGKAPTLLQPSGGPASDAVTALATCMQDMSKCGSLCN